LSDVAEQSSTLAGQNPRDPATVCEAALVEEAWISVWPEFSTVGLNAAVGDIAENVSLNCCEGSKGKENQESLHFGLKLVALA
jgi:hypothetical protein